MDNGNDFPEKVVDSFKKIINETAKNAPEHDIRYKFVRYFVEGVLGYESKHIQQEHKRADITIVDENNFGVIKIETKRHTEDIDKSEHEEQAFSYEDDTTKYIGLTNFLRLKIWKVSKTERKLIADIDFYKIIQEQKKLSPDEEIQILSLNNITKDALFEPSMYEKFNETYARIDITKDTGFKKLLERLNFIANGPLWEYTLRSFGEYKEGYGKYYSEKEKTDSALRNKSNGEIKQQIAKYRMKIEKDYEKYLSFSGFELWKYYSGKENLPEDEVQKVFCKETIYVLLNKLLFIRICEDKGLLPKNISNGGIERLRESIFNEDARYKEVIEISFRSASGLYAHFYETGVLDWFRTGDGELDRLLNRVLWTLNQFNFAHVDRDILGNLYEKYLPSVERKKLGEFYTPTDVIDYILTSVEYTYNNDIERKDLLDPACGSGGFIVRASRRLISRYLVKFGKAEKSELRNPKNWKETVSRLNPDEAKIIIEAVKEHVYGLDINPFAVHIAEMNMLFQIIDLYQKVREKYKDYKIGKFNIYRTDSLEFPRQKQVWDYGAHGAFIQEQDDINEIKQKKFDFVVGNPPYVRVQMLDERAKEYLTNTYSSAVGIFDLYVIFIERGFNWLKQKGKLGYIVSNKFIQSAYGKGIRGYLVKNCTIDQMIDFGDSGVFKDATNYPFILIGLNELSKNNIFKFSRVILPKEDILDEIRVNLSKEFYKSDSLEIFEINQNKLTENSWTFSNPAVIKISTRIEKASNNFFIGSFARPHRSLYTGLNEAYLVDRETIIRERLEDALIKKVIGGSDVQKWKINWNEQFIIYPYRKANNEICPVSLDDYPNIKRHIEQFKEKLMARWFVSKIRKEEQEKRWFEYADPRNFEQFENIKVITPDISTNNRFVLDLDKFYSLNTSYVIDLDKFNYEPKYLLGLLNSSTLEFYFKQISPFISGGYYRYINQYLERLPIKLPETAEENKIANQIIKKVDEILALTKNSADLNFGELLKGKETEKLSGISSVSFALKDGAKFENLKADGNKIFINSGDFIEIKDKKTRDFVFACLQSMQDKLKRAKDAKALIYNLEIPKDEELLKEIGKNANFGGAQTKEKIAALEAEINEMVYELYGITKAERKIID